MVAALVGRGVTKLRVKNFWCVPPPGPQSIILPLGVLVLASVLTRSG